jgi:hypothetical protein
MPTANESLNDLFTYEADQPPPPAVSPADAPPPDAPPPVPDAPAVDPEMVGKLATLKAEFGELIGKLKSLHEQM